MTDTVDVIPALELLRTLLTPRAAWTKYRSACTRWGFRCEIDAPDAVAFCAYGGLLRVTTDDEIVWAAMTALVEIAGMSVAEFNDSHSHEEVLSWIDRTIAHLRAQRSLVLLLNSVSVAPVPCKALA